MFPTDSVSSPVTVADPPQGVSTFQQVSEDGGIASVVPTTAGNRHSAIGNAKGIAFKRLRFNDDLYVVLLKSVVMTKAHVAEGGCSQQRFEETVNSSISNAPPAMLSSIRHRKWKTLYKRFKNILADHCASAIKETGSTGLKEEVRERTQLLVNIVLEADEAAEIRSVDREEREKRERDL